MTPIAELGLPIRAYNALKRTGIHTVEQLEEMSMKDVCKIRNIGNGSAYEILISVKKYKEDKK